MRLAGQRAVITGAASGLGRAITRAFVDEGAKVVLFDLNGEEAQIYAKDLIAAGHCAVAVSGSVTDVEAVESAMKTAEAAFGGIDILVNNAGVSGNTPSLEMTDEFWNRVVGINMSGVFFCSRAAGRRMALQGSGVIVNISSIFGDLAAPARLAYCAAKAGVCSMTKVLAIEWADKGIRVNAVAPGYIRTALVNDLVEKGRLEIGPLIERTPMKRLGDPQEVAELCVFLSNKQSSYITGQIYAIDGGWAAYGHV